MLCARSWSKPDCIRYLYSSNILLLGLSGSNTSDCGNNPSPKFTSLPCARFLNTCFTVDLPDCLYASANDKFSALSPIVAAIIEFIGLSTVVLYKSSNASKPNLTAPFNGSNIFSTVLFLLCSTILCDNVFNTSASGFTCSIVNDVITSGEKLGYNCAIAVARSASALFTADCALVHCVFLCRSSLYKSCSDLGLSK